jgi:hypothetical protein
MHAGRNPCNLARVQCPSDGDARAFSGYRSGRDGYRGPSAMNADHEAYCLVQKPCYSTLGKRGKLLSPHLT